MKISKVFIIIIFFLTFKAIADEIAGNPIITDGDTIKIINKRIRLHGIDAPESQQLCKKSFKEYRCGIVAAEALIKKINKNQVRCRVQDRLDRYRRYIGVCFVEEINLNQWMVRNGHAVAYIRYSKEYIPDEDFARKNKLGLWQGRFLRPEKWRKLN